jgi:peptidoglycan L-alanyl-D-glutamate endopeptidase CwlK
MKDQVTLDRIELMHPLLKDETHEIYNEICEALNGRAICRFAYTLRTFEEQDKLFLKRPKVTNAKGGQSYHNYGLAVDVVLLKDKDGNGTFETASWETNVDFDGDGVADWTEVVRIFKMYGWEAGIDWKFRDAPHFQKTFGKSIKDLQRMYSAQGKPKYIQFSHL